MTTTSGIYLCPVCQNLSHYGKLFGAGDTLYWEKLLTFKNFYGILSISFTYILIIFKEKTSRF